jgi:hypothetical protein
MTTPTQPSFPKHNVKHKLSTLLFRNKLEGIWKVASKDSIDSGGKETQTVLCYGLRNLSVLYFLNAISIFHITECFSITNDCNGHEIKFNNYLIL